MSKLLSDKYLTRILILMLSSSLMLLGACGDDDSGGSPPEKIKINFSSGALSIDENSGTPLTIVVNLDMAAVDPESFEVNLTTTGYGDDYTTTPNGASGNFKLNVAATGQFTTFTLTPIDNDELDGDKTVTFTLANPSDGLETGPTATLVVTIMDDEVPFTLTPIADVRALFNPDMTVNITDDLVIEGVVTSRNEAVTSRNLFIQDASGAIVLRFDETHTFTQGTTLRVSIQGSDVEDFNDLVQVLNNLALTDATDMGAGTLPTPEVITISQLNSGDFQAELVRIENVFIEEADGLATFNGNNTINDGVSTSTLRSESYSDFADEVLPLGMGTVTGLGGVFSGSQQILPQARSDVFADNPTATITVTQSVTDFGQLMNGQTSTSQMYTVQGTGLTENILVTAPDQFELSLDDAAFSSSVEVDFTAANAGPVDVYIRFAPTSGAPTVHTGDVTHSSAGAAAQSFTVSGEEIGGSSVLLEEDFDYGGTPGDLTTITGNWVNHSGTIPIGYITSSLSMTGYGSSGVGGSATIADPGGSNEDANRAFASQTTGVVYISTLVDIASFTAGGDDYFFHVMDDPSLNNYYARVYAKDDGSGNLNFGIREHSSGTVTYGSGTFAYNTTYLLIIKYDIDNGEVSLFVLDNAATTEPGTAEAVSNDGNNAPAVAAVAMRQGSETPNATFDGIRVALDWAGVIGL